MATSEVDIPIACRIRWDERGRIYVSENHVAIKAGNTDGVRSMLLEEKSLATQKFKDPEAKFDPELQLDAYKFLGAYLGAMTPLHFALLHGQDTIAKDIIERSFTEDLDDTFGGGNTALHLATFLGAKDLVKLLLERGANRTIRNAKGFAPVDILDDPDMRQLFE